MNYENLVFFHSLNVVWYCSSPPGTRGFQIYEETGLTPAQATRPGATNKHHISLHSVKRANTDKENQFMAAAATAAAAAAVNPQAEEEPMAVDFVNIFFVFMALSMLWY